MTTERETILIVDDTPENLDILVGILKNGYRLKVTTDGQSALELATAAAPDLVLLDIMMPEMDGFEVCRRLKAKRGTGDVPVIFVSALDRAEDKILAFTKGGVDYVTKPFQPEVVRARVETHLRLRRLQKEQESYSRELESRVAAQVKEIAAGQFATIFALSKLAESRDDDTGKHLERVQAFCRLLATALRDDSGYSDQIDDEFIENIHHASPLHDIGKVATPDSILLKPGKLTNSEFEVMKTHTTHGARTLEAVASHYPDNAFVNMGISIAQSHHERWDGRGYPQGLSGEAIPLSARIMSLADIYDALTSKRCYKDAFSHEKARGIIEGEHGKALDPQVVAAFRRLAGDFHGTRDRMRE
jgi:putative two-component system response regulator